MLTLILKIVVALAFVVVVYYKFSFQYWKKKKLISYPSPSIPFGNLKNPFSKSSLNFGIQLSTFCQYFKSKGEKHGGIFFFSTPVYIPFNLDLLKHIMTINFDHFSNKGIYHNEKDQPITGHLFQLGGAKWRKLRTKLTPTFTSGKMKMMFLTLLECCKPLENCVANFAKGDKVFDMRDISSKFTTDVIGSCAFGLECNSFKDPNSEFVFYGRKAFAVDIKRIFLFPLMFSFPKMCQFFGFKTLPDDVVDFFTRITTDNVRYRQDHNVKRNDFIHLLMEMLNKENPDERIDVQEIVNQSFLFFNAGFETSSTTMSYLFFEISQNREIQDKIRKEINEVLKKHDGQITYEAVTEMKYLQQVLDETLRKYPPLPIVNRECTKDYKVPDTDVVINKGTLVNIPVYAIHRDPEYYPNPEKFDPDRFSDENKRTRHPYAFLPFGEGPRLCIGQRFGYMQAKVGIVVLLRKFRFNLSPKAIVPLTFNQGLIMSPQQEILIKCEEL